MRSRAIIVLMLLPAILVIAVFLVALVGVLAAGFQDRAGGFTLQAFVDFFGDARARGALTGSFLIAVSSTAICFALGFPIALIIARGPRLLSRFAMLALAIQFFSIYVVKMYGWMLVLGNNGIVNRSLQAAGITNSPIRLMYNELGVAIGLVGAALPLMVFPINAVLQSVDPRLEEAAFGLGANRGRTLALITLPLCLPGIASGTVLAFVFCFTAYLTPALLGGGFFKMIGNVIYDQAVGRFNYGAASAAATITLIVSITVILLISRLGRIGSVSRA